VGVSTTIVSILEDFLSQNPSKERSAEEKAELRLEYRPGGSVLPEHAILTPLSPVASSRSRSPPARLRSQDSRPQAAMPRRLRSPSRLDGRGLQRVRAASQSDPFSLERPSNSVPSHHLPTPHRSPIHPSSRSQTPVLDLQRVNHSPYTSPRLLARLLSPPPEELPCTVSPNSRTSIQPRLSPRPAITPRSRSPSLPISLPLQSSSFDVSSPTSIPSSVLEILQRSQERIIITCDHCHLRLDTSIYLECAGCPLFHLCLRCYRSGHTCPAPASERYMHYLTRQKLIASWPRRYIQVGIFCDVCDLWIDEDRNNTARMTSMFWHCEICNKGCWCLCVGCVQRGWNCTHELVLYTNNRLSSSASSSTPSPSSSLIRGGNIGRATSEGRFQVEPFSSQEVLREMGYFLWNWSNYSAVCTLCKLSIHSPNTWLHCFGCPETLGGDLCTTCFYNLHRTFPSQSRSLHSFFVCPRGHPTTVLAQPGKNVIHRGVFAHAPKPRPPEWITARLGGGGEVIAHAKSATAVKGHWPEECDDNGECQEGRKWGRGQWLCFPEAAEILDVVTAFSEQGGSGGVMEWCWGSYAGVGGLFPRDFVRFTESRD
jgi:hypothetical protein